MVLIAMEESARLKSKDGKIMFELLLKVSLLGQRTIPTSRLTRNIDE